MTTAWLAAPSEQKPAISLATHALERELQLRPNEIGESRSDDRRMAICLPVALTYQVSDDDLIVRVEAFRLITRRNR